MAPSNANTQRTDRLREMAIPGLHNKVREIFLSLHIPRTSRVLILGSGEGAFEQPLAQLGYDNITAVDLYTDYKVRKHVTFLKADLNDPNFSSKLGKPYDVVVCLEIIEHLDNTSAFLVNVSRLVKKKGIVIVSTPNPHSGVARVDALLTGYPTWFIAEPQQAGHLSPIYYTIFRYYANLHGLTITRRVGYGSLWDYIKAYKARTCKSVAYLCVLTFLRVILSPFMLFNGELRRGGNSIFILTKR